MSTRDWTGMRTETLDLFAVAAGGPAAAPVRVD